MNDMDFHLDRPRSPLALLFHWLTIALCTVLLATTLVIALRSPMNSSPDEQNHILAAQYYFSHWFPPIIGSPENNATRSVWGNSYLDELDVAYFLCGKIARVASFFTASEYLPFRVLNWLLLLGYVLCALRFRYGYLALLPLLTPQTWYVFTYCNGDALPLVLSSLCSLVLLGVIGRMPHPGSLIWTHREILTFGVLVGTLIISKRNYLTYLGTLPLFVGAALFVQRSKAPRATILKGFLLAAAVACVLLAARLGVEIMVNGFDRDRKIAEVQEQTAGYAFKRGTPLDQSYPSTWLKRKGVSFGQLFNQWHWHDLSWKSFMGVYGFMTIAAPDWYYQFTLLLVSGGLLGALLLSALLRERLPLLLFGICLIGIAATIAGSLYRTWTYAFQAQGRYLFPILPLLIVPCGELARKCREGGWRWPQRLAQGFVVAMLILSTYSLVVIAGQKLIP